MTSRPLQLDLPTFEAVDALPVDALVDAATRLAALLERAHARLIVAVSTEDRTTHEGDRLLDAEEAAARLNTTKDWLYRNRMRFPFTVQLSAQQVRFSDAGIARWIAGRSRRAR